MTPDFTIVTASYNYGEYIRECLESVARQKGVTFEHLVYDAGSSDDTAEVVSGFPHVKFVQEPDEGMTDAINKGFRVARGKWVMWLNADDRLVAGALQAVLDFAKGKENTDVIYGGWNFINQEGALMRSVTVFPFQKSMLSSLVCYLGSTSTFFRNSTVMGEGHHLNEDYRYVMDGEFYNRLAGLGKKFAYMHALLAEFRLHGGNLSSRYKEPSNASEQLILERQHAESIAIRRVYGSFRSLKAPWVWMADSVLFGYYLLKKAIFKRLYRSFHRLIELESE